MIDYEKIGRRIAEQRKYILKMSQERLAEALGMYQADVSNLEKAKKGSGITDLSKLDFIADYFGISLENLLFGKGVADMPKYTENKMELKASKKGIKKAHRDILAKLTGNDANKISGASFTCGPYSIYVLEEHQLTWGENTTVVDDQIQNPGAVLVKLHVFILYGTEMVSITVADVTSTFQHVYQSSLAQLQRTIQMDVLDVTDVLRTLNPYWALARFSEDNQEEYESRMYRRMDEIRALGQMYVLYIESAYVREDYRQLGMLRLSIDVLRKLCGDCIMWLNMEPTAGAELSNEYRYFPSYTVSELGQLSLNASIAEKLGFTIDPDTWRRQAEVVLPDGSVQTEIVRIRKCAYYLPQAVRDMIKADGDLVSLGRALQKISDQNNEDQNIVDIREGEIDGYIVTEWSEKTIIGPGRGRCLCFYAGYRKDNVDNHRFGVSYKSVFEHGIMHEGQLETYDYLDDAVDSEHFESLCTVNSLVICHLNLPDEEEGL